LKSRVPIIDDQLGRILQALEESGQRDNTIVVFTSDHGETLGDHGLVQKGCRFYEGLVRVPLIFSWPGHIEAGQRSDALVELSDKAPTLLQLCGQEIPEDMTGKSLAPILTGEVSPEHHRDFVRCEYYDALKARDGTLATMYRDRRYNPRRSTTVATTANSTTCRRIPTNLTIGGRIRPLPISAPILSNAVLTPL